MPGSGLGLAIVAQVAERHGGTVVAGRGPEGGASFWLHVPGSPNGPEEPPGRSEQGALGQGQGTRRDSGRPGIETGGPPGAPGTEQGHAETAGHASANRAGQATGQGPGHTTGQRTGPGAGRASR